MNRYAAFINFCGVHLPGFNAFINGLDLWENDIDLVAIYESEGASAIPEWYLEELRKQPFRFTVRLVRYEEILERYKDGVTDYFVNAIFAPYKVMLEMADEYDAVSYWGGDESMLGNVQNWYKIGAQTDLILLFKNPYQLQPWYDWRPERDPHPDHYWDMPLICNPRTHRELIERIFETKYTLGNNLHGTNRALWELSLMEKVLPLPDIIWTVALPYNYRMAMHWDSKNRPMLFAANDQVMSFHKKWWHNPVCDAYCHDKKGGLHIDTEKNVYLMRDMYDLYNRIGKVKLNYHRYKDSQGNWQIGYEHE